MHSEKTPVLGDLNELKPAEVRRRIEEWLKTRDNKRLSDIDYAVSLLELGVSSDRGAMTSNLSIGALIVALASLVASVNVARAGVDLTASIALAVMAVMIPSYVLVALMFTRRAQRAHDEQRAMLVRLYDLRDRAPRYRARRECGPGGQV